MLIIGIHNTGIISSAALVADGRIVHGAAEERLTRQKHSKHFPHNAIEACLKSYGAELRDVDCFAIGWNPALNIAERYRAGFSEWPSHAGERFFANPNQLLPRLELEELTTTDQVFFSDGGAKTVISYVNHHLCHAANAYILSGFDEAAILVCDSYGELDTMVFSVGRKGKIENLKCLSFPHSLGGFYSAVTEFLGFRPDHDEWKVMGAAAFGDPATYRQAMRKLVVDEADGAFRLDLTWFDHFNFDTRSMFSRRVEELFGQPRKGGELDQRHFDIAAAAQERLEEALFRAMAWLKGATGADNLCLSGGVAMNSVFNGKATLEGTFERVYAPFAPDDSGNAIGAALVTAMRHGEPVDLGGRLASPFLGGSFDDDQIKETLERFRLPFETVENPAETAAALLAENNIVGWFQGRSEFGQRALGGRSILADPRDAATKDRVNSAVKFRESFRPFAPAVAAEDVADYFQVPEGTQAGYMEKVFLVRPEKRDAIAAVVHIDGSGRLQTVDKNAQPLFHGLIKAFQARAGVPVVLNTSFNLNGEPIVETPSDAIRTFMTSGMDALIMERQLVVKSGR